MPSEEVPVTLLKHLPSGFIGSSQVVVFWSLPTLSTQHLRFPWPLLLNILQGTLHMGTALFFLQLPFFFTHFLASPYPLLYCLNYYLSSDLWPTQVTFCGCTCHPIPFHLSSQASIYYPIHVNDCNYSLHSHINPKILWCITSLGAI